FEPASQGLALLRRNGRRLGDHEQSKDNQQSGDSCAGASNNPQRVPLGVFLIWGIHGQRFCGEQPGPRPMNIPLTSLLSIQS
ncbi:MAG TPA: hypothetical protein V6D08_13960, partial [Candidatus Obscuribacterales bacterium]